jgi:hypothetical protein
VKVVFREKYRIAYSELVLKPDEPPFSSKVVISLIPEQEGSREGSGYL